MKKALTALFAVTFTLAALSGCSSTAKNCGCGTADSAASSGSAK